MAHQQRPSRASWLFTLPGGRRTRWLVLVAWIVVVAALSPFAEKIADVEENDAAAFLPQNAESLRVTELEQQFQAGDVQNAVVVCQRDGGLAPADFDKIETDRQALEDLFPDSALLLIARYREELRRHESKYEAMAFALRQAGPAILASGGTTILGLLCLTVADVNSTSGLGPVGAFGILSALIAMLTLLPAVLVIFDRRPWMVARIR